MCVPSTRRARSDEAAASRHSSMSMNGSPKPYSDSHMVPLGSGRRVQLPYGIVTGFWPSWHTNVFVVGSQTSTCAAVTPS